MQTAPILHIPPTTLVDTDQRPLGHIVLVYEYQKPFLTLAMPVYAILDHSRNPPSISEQREYMLANDRFTCAFYSDLSVSQEHAKNWIQKRCLDEGVDVNSIYSPNIPIICGVRLE